MSLPEKKYIATRHYAIFSATFLIALLCVGATMLGGNFGWRWLSFAGVIIGAASVLIGGGAVIFMAFRK